MKNLRCLRSLKKSECGFTLIEIVVALAVVGVLSTAIVMIISQIYTTNMRDSARMTAVQNAQSALHWLSRDVQMAQTVQTGGTSGFPLQLNWVEWETNDAYSVTYTLVDGEFRRGTSINGEEADEIMVADYINADEDKTFCSFSGRVLNLSLTASVPYGFHTASETRIVEILARPGS
ncbi:MAG: prepilin-type N-terminal cleavage/methylation domain-containing protein [Dehalococcoidales bacterium]|nr:prepilin-type N-terminal cleavage/methylation domain-containing protein [Dehalococcoidales bacterium]